MMDTTKAREMYESGLSLQSVAEAFGVCKLTIRRVLVKVGCVIRPKHVTLSRKGPIGYSGAKSATWKGGKSKCVACGADLNHWKKDARCWLCEKEARKHKPRMHPEQCKTDESKLWRKRIEFKDWRKGVFDRDGYKCRICSCNTRDLHPHHLEGFADNPELRFEIDNGVTLCAEHHKQFHRQFGYGANTAYQFQQFISQQLLAA